MHARMTPEFSLACSTQWRKKRLIKYRVSHVSKSRPAATGATQAIGADLASSQAVTVSHSEEIVSEPGSRATS